MAIGRKSNSDHLVVIFISILTVVSLSTPRLVNAETKRPYIVYLGGHAHQYHGNEDETTMQDLQHAATHKHHQFLASFLKSDEDAGDAIFYSYNKHINGFAAHLRDEEAEQIAGHPEVVSVFPDEKLQLHTTRSWEMMEMVRGGSDRVPHASIWSKSSYGRDAIIANLDSGVWPESQSFQDQGMGPIPKKWKGSCTDDPGNKFGVRCNKKLIGAKYFSTGAAFATGEDPVSLYMNTSRDDYGHGTHTLSTAGGRFVPGADALGFGRGTARGGAPSARVAAYKTCWGGGCQGSDIIAGFDAAISDGADIISVSLGGNPTLYTADPIAIGALHAVSQGITVVCSASNTGPLEGTVSNAAPWVVTVGASTIDRRFPSYLKLGNNKTIRGVSLSQEVLTKDKFYPLVYAGDAAVDGPFSFAAESCYPDTVDPAKVRGKIVACYDGMNDDLEKDEVVRKAGGVGVVVMASDPSADSNTARAHIVPATQISNEDALLLLSYINSTNSPVAQMTPPVTKLRTRPAPQMAAFSSRGPSLVTPHILKPDITAPGVNILASWGPAQPPSSYANDPRWTAFNIISGTSMSCPHVAGVAALLRTLHPDWSPAAIRSAIMTTARTRSNTMKKPKPILDSNMDKATPFAYGSGHVWPNRAMDPGLVYDTKVGDYLDFLCALGYNDSFSSAAGVMASAFNYKHHHHQCPEKKMKLEDLNYPSISVPDLRRSIVVSRVVKNVGGAPASYKARVVAPPGVSVAVRPMELRFEKVGEEKGFKVVIKSGKGSVGVGYGFGKIIWSDGKHYVRTPLAVNAMS